MSLAKESRFERPYTSKRRRAAGQRPKGTDSSRTTNVLRMLAFLVVVLVVALAVVIKG